LLLGFHRGNLSLFTFKKSFGGSIPPSQPDALGLAAQMTIHSSPG